MPVEANCINGVSARRPPEGAKRSSELSFIRAAAASAVLGRIFWYLFSLFAFLASLQVNSIVEQRDQKQKTAFRCKIDKDPSTFVALSLALRSPGTKSEMCNGRHCKNGQEAPSHILQPRDPRDGEGVPLDNA